MPENTIIFIVWARKAAKDGSSPCGSLQPRGSPGGNLWLLAMVSYAPAVTAIWGKSADDDLSLFSLHKICLSNKKQKINLLKKYTFLGHHGAVA